MKTIVIGCDNAAVDMKNMLIKFLTDKGIIVEDVGCKSSDDSTYYPIVAQQVCESIINSNYKKEGILLCGTGIGMAMTANKFKGIRAAVCHDIFSAERAKLSNDSNILCMGERVIGYELAKKIVAEWIFLEFIDGSSTVKVEAMKEIEKNNLK